MAHPRIRIFPLFHKLRLFTAADDSTKVYVDLNVPGISDILPQAEQVWLASLTEQMPGTNDVQWNVVIVPGYDREHEATEFKLDVTATDINTNGPLRSALVVASIALPTARPREGVCHRKGRKQRDQELPGQRGALRPVVRALAEMHTISRRRAARPFRACRCGEAKHVLRV